MNVMSRLYFTALERINSNFISMSLEESTEIEIFASCQNCTWVLLGYILIVLYYDCSIVSLHRVIRGRTLSIINRKK